MQELRTERKAAVRPGGRSERVRNAVLATVEEILSTEGFDALSIETVAERSHVHRTTVYRRWGSVAMLLVDLLARGEETAWRPPSTGTLEGDLVAINREVQASLSDDGSVVAAVIMASFSSPDVEKGLRRFWADRFERAAEVVDRAIGRGEIPEETDGRLLISAATAPIFFERIFLRRHVSAADAEAYARMAATAARESSD